MARVIGYQFTPRNLSDYARVTGPEGSGGDQQNFCSESSIHFASALAAVVCLDPGFQKRLPAPAGRKN